MWYNVNRPLIRPRLNAVKRAALAQLIAAAGKRTALVGRMDLYNQSIDYAPKELKIVPLNRNNALSAHQIYSENITTLDGAEISPEDFFKYRTEEENGSDERNFLITLGDLPIAWLKINGLTDNDTAWISMIAVKPEYQRQGAGTFAIGFAEDYAKNAGKSHLKLQTAADNTAANSLYRKLGFSQSDISAQGRVVYEKKVQR
jgi:ribosomal protein S18 acetylase RimI-like enzyme